MTATLRHASPERRPAESAAPFRGTSLSYAGAFQDCDIWQKRPRANLLLEDLEDIFRGLAGAMPTLKIAQYFDAKGATFLDSDFLFCATGGATAAAVALLVSKWMPLDSSPVLHIQTLLIGSQYQRSHLITRLWSAQLGALQASCPAKALTMAMKTYNPSSYNAMQIFSRVKGAAFYPHADAGNMQHTLRRLAQEIAAYLHPHDPFDANLGIIRGGGGAVVQDFYPDLPHTSNATARAFFSRNLTPADRLLCILSLDENALPVVLRRFGVDRRDSPGETDP
jgi:hypothetical protein